VSDFIEEAQAKSRVQPKPTLRKTNKNRALPEQPEDLTSLEKSIALSKADSES
jgi:hypothetical protein